MLLEDYFHISPVISLFPARIYFVATQNKWVHLVSMNPDLFNTNKDMLN